MTAQAVQVILCVLIGLAAVVEDLRRRTISNWIPVAALAGGVACHVWIGGWRGAGTAILGAAAGFGIFLVFYLLGGMGGGDVKLMAGFGALLGAGRLLEAALWTAGIGGLLALGALGAAWLRSLGRPPAERREPRAIPYAPAIALGVWLSLVPKG